MIDVIVATIARIHPLRKLTGLRPSPTRLVAVSFRFSRKLTQGPAVRLADRRHPLRLDVLTMTRSAFPQVAVTCDGRSVAVHHRCPATGQTITDRSTWPRPGSCPRSSPAPPPAALDDLARDLSDYDTASGVVVKSDGQVA